MKSFTHNSLNDFIAGWYIDTDICDLIMIKSESNLLKFKSGIKEYTNCDLVDLDKRMYDRYATQLNQVVEEYKRLYPYCYKTMQVWGWTPPRIQRYDPGRAYNEIHCENNGESIYHNRHLAYMTYLNDIEDGGGTEFIQQNLEVKAEKGLTLIWPAGWTHHHRGIVSSSEIKYIITGWFCFYPS